EPGTLEAVRPAAWPQSWTSQLLELITVLTLLAELGPARAALTDAPLPDPVGRSALRAAGVLPVPSAARRPASVLDTQEEGPEGQLALLCPRVTDRGHDPGSRSRITVPGRTRRPPGPAPVAPLLLCRLPCVRIGSCLGLFTRDEEAAGSRGPDGGRAGGVPALVRAGADCAGGGVESGQCGGDGAAGPVRQRPGASGRRVAGGAPRGRVTAVV